MTLKISADAANNTHLVDRIRTWATELGFQHLGVTGIDQGDDAARLEAWLARSFHGEMQYMARNREKRCHPDALVPGTRSILSARMHYLPAGASAESVLAAPRLGYISRYAVGRDYHKVIRKRLNQLILRLRAELGDYRFEARPFSDSAPVLEKAIAQRSGAGWIGKNTLLIHREAGSFFFLGEIYTDLPLPADAASVTNHCGSCRACLDRCPTGAFHGPYQLDARRCISYLTIESRGAIAPELRPLMGNRIFGCDDCQLVCPWNRTERLTGEPDFSPRHHLDAPDLLELFSWSEDEYLANTEGSPIRRAGYHGWLRNVAVALGNAPGDRAVVEALERRVSGVPPMVAEHIEWAIGEQRRKLGDAQSAGTRISADPP